MSPHTLLASVALAVLAPLAAAQSQAAPAPAPRTPAGAATLHVTGLQGERAAALEQALGAHENSTWHCSACSAIAFEAGTCCGSDLRVSTGKAFSAVQVDPEGGSIAFAVAPQHAVRLSELARVLAQHGAQADTARTPLGAQVLLVLGNVADQQALDAARKALVDAQVFRKLDARLPAGSQVAHLLVLDAGSAPPRGERVSSVLAEVDPAVTLAEIAWCSPAGGG